MARPPLLWAAAVFSLTVPLPALAQTEFVAAARAGTARYRDREVAVADGYRPVGPDFPGMGEHWINPFLLVTGELDPARPPVLEYADIGGRPTLVGVAYAALVADTAMPRGLPVPPQAWHTHAGSVDEESFILSHAGAAAVHQHVVAAERGGGRGPRVAVVHAWIWLDNPAGLFETDNWALPFARLGLVAPTGISADAGRGLSLAVGRGGSRYFATLIRMSGRPDSAEQARLAGILDSAGAAVAALVRSDAGAESFAAAWRRVWAAVLEAASPAVRERLAALDAR